MYYQVGYDEVSELYELLWDHVDDDEQRVEEEEPEVAVLEGAGHAVTGEEISGEKGELGPGGPRNHFPPEIEGEVTVVGQKERVGKTVVVNYKSSDCLEIRPIARTYEV